MSYTYRYRLTTDTATDVYTTLAASAPAPSVDVVPGTLTIVDSTVASYRVEKTTAPTSANDYTEGYAIGDEWVNTTTDRSYVCTDNASGAAVWKEETLQIDDATSTLVDTWSSSKISSAIASAGSNITSLIGVANGIASLDADVKVPNAQIRKGEALSVASLDVDAKVPDAQIRKGEANSVAELDSSGKVPTAQLPAIAITDVYVVADETARDALTVQTGDVAKITNGKTYIYNGTELPYGWILLDDRNISTTEVSEGTNLYYTNTRADARVALHGDLTNNPHATTLDQVMSAQQPTALTKNLGNLVVGNGTSMITLAAGTDGQTLKADSTTASGLKWVNDYSDMAYSFGAGLRVASTAAFTDCATMVFKGSTAAGTPTKIEVIVGATNLLVNEGFKYRIYDVTNATVIATSAVTTATNKTILELTGLANISTGPAIWELQVQDMVGVTATNHAGVARIYSALVRFTTA